jgi:RecA/RadA recombinase
MAKIDVSKIVTDMQKLYSKDKKVHSLICTGNSVKTEYTQADVVPLPGSHPLSTLLMLPGLPFNKIVQVAGRPDCGKSTWASEAAVAAQKSGIQVIYTDAEDKFDAGRFTKMGGDPNKVLMIKSNETLKAGELARKYIIAVKEQDPEAKILWIVDSIGASQSRSHAERELDSERHAQPGADAKENSSLMKMTVALINKYPDSIAVYLVNQTYAKIGFMQKGDAISGGTKIEYHSSFIVMLKRIKTLTKTVKGSLTKYGIISRATVSKNHLSQGKTSIHQLDFTVTSEGSSPSEGVESDDESEE